jgi:hypothetical protein
LEINIKYSLCRENLAAAKPIYLKNGDASGYEYFAKNLGVNIAQNRFR